MKPNSRNIILRPRPCRDLRPLLNQFTHNILRHRSDRAKSFDILLINTPLRLRPVQTPATSQTKEAQQLQVFPHTTTVPKSQPRSFPCSESNMTCEFPCQIPSLRIYYDWLCNGSAGGRGLQFPQWGVRSPYFRPLPFESYLVLTTAALSTRGAYEA